VSTTSRTIEATPDDVLAVLADGWLYPLWVVGASRMRAVDDAWPEPGARLHHSVGAWPALIDDYTEVRERERLLLTLRARAWPSGEAEVRIRLEPVGTDTRVTIEEDVVGGPARLLPGPARHPMLHLRNTETLRRLALLVEGRRT
jgi:hypothetical protein